MRKSILLMLVAYLAIGAITGAPPAENVNNMWDWHETDKGLRVELSGQRFISRELVQLIDRSEGWEGIDAYEDQEMSAEPQQLDSGHTGTRRLLQGRLHFRRQTWSEGRTLHIKLSCELRKPTPATDHYYSLQISAKLLENGAWRAIVDDGPALASEFMAASGGHTLAEPFRKLEIVTASLHLVIRGQSKGAGWSFQDWRNDRHDAYRFRIELPAEKGTKWQGKLELTAKKQVPPVDEFVARTRKQARRELVPTSDAELQMHGVTVVTDTPTVGRTCELVADLDCTFDDPFNPDDVSVKATVVTPERSYTVPGFYHVPFERHRTDEVDKITSGQPQWRVRFLPTVSGNYQVKITARDRNGRVTAEPVDVSVHPREWKGLVRVSERNPLALCRENGGVFYPIGVNIFDHTAMGAPLPPDRIDASIKHIRKLADAGGNFIRLRMDSWWFAIDNPVDPVSGYLGAGKFNQRACRDIDRIISECERLGIQIMLCIENANENVNSPHRTWRKRYNAYSEANGGPCGEMSEFWTDEEAKKLFRRKIRYCVARWSASPALAMWEFFNEVHISGHVPTGPVVAWHEQMAQEFKRLDPHRRIVTTSPGGGSSKKARDKLWQQPHLDVAQLHDYRRVNTSNVYRTASYGAGSHGKPFIVGEFGMSGRIIRSNKYSPDQDTNGLVLHLGHWSSALSRAAGAPLAWRVGNYIDPLGLWDDFTHLKRFVGDIPRDDPQLKSITVQQVTQAPAEKLSEPIDVTVSPTVRWEKAETGRFRITEDGTVEPSGHLNGWLWGLKYHVDLRNPPAFIVDYPTDGRFVVRVGEVVGRGSNPVRIMMDGETVLREDLVCEKGKTDRWEVRQPGPNGNIAVWYNRELAIDVPEGEHEITVQNLGRDRLEAAYRFEKYATYPKSPQINVFGLQHSAGADAWIHNNTWSAKMILGSVRHTPAHEVTVTLAGLNDGTLRAETWNPRTGTVTNGPRQKTVRKGTLELQVGSIAKDMALKLRYVQ